MTRPDDDPIASARAEISATGVEPATRVTPAGASAPLPGEQPGDLIGRYRLQRFLGEGGMGTVWLAEQSEPVRRSVALKVIKLGMDSREVVGRFEAERQALALMNHPHIARVFDGGATDKGRPYFVMELVEGTPITTYCDDHQLGVSARLALFRKVCAAIQHAHHKGIIHRDIKPSNVLVSDHEGAAVPKVIDFGVAKATCAELTRQTAFTQHAQLIGTPECMAPEQAEGGELDVDTRADVYSLGVLLYELLTGTRPFEIQRARSAGYQELLRTIQETDPDKPSTRISTLGTDAEPMAAQRNVDAGDLRERLRGDLDWIVMKTLEKDRNRRYESATALADDVWRALHDEPVTAVPPSTAYRLRKLLRRRRKTVAAALVVTLLFVAGSVGTGFGWWKAHQANQAKDAALQAQEVALKQEESQRRLAQELAERASRAEASASARAAELEQLAGFYAEQLTDLDPEWMGVRFRQELLDAVARDDRRTLDALIADMDLTGLAVDWMDEHLFQRTLDAIDLQFHDQPRVRATLLSSLAETLDDVGMDERALDPRRQALELRRASLGRDHLDTVRATAALGRSLYFAGHLDDAEPLLVQALDQLQLQLGEEHEETLKALNDLGRLHTALRHFDEAERVHRQVLAASRRVLGEDHKLSFDALHDLGSVLAQTDRLSEADEVLRQALAQAHRLFGEDDTLTLVTLANLGMQLELVGRFSEAQQCYEQALEGTRQKLGEQHPLTVGMHFGVARNLAHQGHYPKALAWGQDNWSRRKQVYGESHPKTLNVVHDMGVWLIKAGELTQAVALYEELLIARRRVLGEDHPDTLMTVNNTAVAVSQLGDQARAQTLFEQVVAGWRVQSGDRSQNTLAAIHNLGRTLHSQELFAKAEPLYREAVAGRLETLGALDNDYLIAMADLGIVLADLGRPAEALPVLTETIDSRREHYWELSDPQLEELIAVLAEVLVALDRSEEASALLAEGSLDGASNQGAARAGGLP